jgi:hypothetical protein
MFRIYLDITWLILIIVASGLLGFVLGRAK